LYFSVNLCF